MKCYSLKMKSTNRHQNPLFLAQVPIMPNMYLLNQKGKNIAVLQKEGEPELLLASDSEEFTNRYMPYYEDRFTVEEKEEDFVVPQGFEVAYGKMSFSNEAEPEENLEAEVE